MITIKEIIYDDLSDLAKSYEELIYSLVNKNVGE